MWGVKPTFFHTVIFKGIDTSIDLAYNEQKPGTSGFHFNWSDMELKTMSAIAVGNRFEIPEFLTDCKHPIEL